MIATLLRLMLLIGLPSIALGAPAGQLDSTFGGLGTGIRTLGFNNPNGNKHDDGTAMATAADGRIYLVGAVTTGVFRYGIGIARLSADGVPDDSFGVNGKLTIIHPSFDSIHAFDAAFQASGRLVVVGAGFAAGSPSPGLVACGFKPDGTLDPTFGDPATAGCRVMEISSNSAAYGMVIQPDNGRIIMVGQTTVNGLTRAVMVRLTGNGALDASFDYDGVSLPYQWFDTDHGLNDVALTPEGDIVVAGWLDTGGGNWDYLAGRFTKANGIRDLSFNEGYGYRAVKFDGADDLRDVATSVAVTPDGAVVLSGYTRYPGDSQYRASVAKLTKEGEAFVNWNGSGKRTYNPCVFIVGGCDMRAFDTLLLPNGQLVIAGALGVPGNGNTNSFFAMRLSGTGEPDAMFGTLQPGQAGTALIPVSNGLDTAYRIGVQGSRIVLAGTATPVPATSSDFAVLRLDHGLNAAFTVTPGKVGNGTINPAVAQVVAHSAHVKFTVTPAANNAIKSVSGCGGALIGNIYTTGPITANCQVQAVFASDVTLTYGAGPNGTVQGPSPQVIPYNGNGQQVKAVPDVGYTFDRWSDLSNSAWRTDVNVKQDINVVALFKPTILKLAGTPITEGGGVMPPEGKPVEYGSSDFLTIQPAPGYGLAGVGGCDGTLVGNVYLVGPMTESCYFDVAFEPSDATYLLSYDAGPNCKIAGPAKQQVKSGFDGQQVVATAVAGYQFLQWSDGGKNPVRTDTHVFDHLDVTAQCAPLDAELFIVKPVSGKGGALSPFADLLVAKGQGVMFEALPAPGFGIDSVSGCGGTLMGNVFTTAPVVADCMVEATFVQSGAMYALEYAIGAGGKELIGDAEQTVPSGGSGTAVTAVPLPGRKFVQWSDGSTDNPRQDKSVTGNIDVVAQFVDEGSLLVTPKAGVGGSISPHLVQVVQPGGALQFIVSPDLGYTIDDVVGCGGSLEGKLFTTAPVMADCLVQATFIATDEQYLLRYTAGPNGDVNGQAVVETAVPSGGTGPEVTAMPDVGYVFLQWSDGSVENPRTDVSVIGPVDVTAQFIKPDDIVVTPVVVGGIGGSLEPALAQVVVKGQVVEFEVKPDPGYGIAKIDGCGGQLAGNIYTTAAIEASCTVEVLFESSDDTYVLTYTAGAGGKVNGQAVVVQEVVSGGSGAAVTAQGSPGFFFVQWSDGSQENPRTDSNVVTDLSITAQFALNGSLVVTPMVDGVGGTLEPALAQVVQPGDVVVFAVKPQPGYVIDAVKGCDGSLEGNLYTTGPVVASCQVTASFAASDATFLLSYTAGPNGAIVGEAAQEVIAGGSGTPVTAVPSPGYMFVKWSDFPAWLSAERVDENVVGDVAVIATFAPEGTPTYIVTATAGAGGDIDPDGEQLAVEGESIIFTLKPEPGFVIDVVEGCDGNLVGNLYQTAPVTADCEVDVSFAPANGQQFSLSYTAGPGGKVNGQNEIVQMVLAGSDGPQVDATANPGFFFVQWSDGVDANPRTDTSVAADIEVTAVFAANGTPIHVVTPMAGIGGALSPLLPLKVPQGQSAQFEVLPQPGHVILDVAGTCGGTLVGNLYTTDPAVGDCTVEATFADSDEVFSLNYVAGPNGTVNGVGVVQLNVLAGTNGPVVAAQPANGFVFVQWSDGSTENPRQDTNVAADVDVVATFAAQGATTYTVTPVAGVGGGLSPALAQQIEEGQAAEFIVLPDDGYAVDTIGGTCGGSLMGNVYTTDPVTANCTVEATFYNDRIFANDFELPPEP